MLSKQKCSLIILPFSSHEQTFDLVGLLYHGLLARGDGVQRAGRGRLGHLGHLGADLSHLVAGGFAPLAVGLALLLFLAAAARSFICGGRNALDQLRRK